MRLNLKQIDIELITLFEALSSLLIQLLLRNQKVLKILGLNCKIDENIILLIQKIELSIEII